MKPTPGLNGTNIGSEYTPDEVEFLRAIDAAKRRAGPHLTCADILAVARALGYRKVAPAGPLPTYPPR